MFDQYDYLMERMAEGENADLVFLDFSKAFNLVDHGLLLLKLKNLGLEGVSI